MRGKSTLQKLVVPGGLFQHSLQEDIGSGHLRHLNPELETVKQGSKASRNWQLAKEAERSSFWEYYTVWTAIANYHSLVA